MDTDLLKIVLPKSIKGRAVFGHNKMPPSSRLPPVVRHHVLNHRIPRGTSTAIFVIYPAGICTRTCPIGWGIRSCIDFYRTHYPHGVRQASNVFVNSWALPGEHVAVALKNLHLHATRPVWRNLDVIVLVYGHASRRTMDFNGYHLPLSTIVRSCNKIRNLSTLGLLGCNTGSRNLPRTSGYSCFGFTQEIDYEELARYAIGFVNIYQSFRRRGFYPSASVSNAIIYSYTVNIGPDQVWLFQ